MTWKIALEYRSMLDVYVTVNQFILSPENRFQSIRCSLNIHTVLTEPLLKNSHNIHVGVQFMSPVPKGLGICMEACIQGPRANEGLPHAMEREAFPL